VRGTTVTRVAAFDCGTNSLRLLIADVVADADPGAATLTELDRRMEIVRLGEGVDRTGRIEVEAIRRTLAVTRRYAELCDRFGVSRMRFVATSATRDAANREDFVAGVQAVLGIKPEVIPGEEEAALSFTGATHELTAGAPFLVVDIGGGSTEFVLGEREVEAACSVDVGCVRMTERHLAADPPTPEQVAAATADVDAALDEVALAVPLGRTRTLVGLAGSVTTVTARVLGLDRYDRDAIHRASLPVADVLAACDDLLAMRRAGRAAQPYMHPGRVDVIGAGALVWRRTIERVAEQTTAAGAPLREVVASEHDILDGIAWSLARSAP